MDWNNDGKVDWKDYAILDSATSGSEKDNYSGGGGDTGCLSVILIGLLVLQILKWLV